MVIITSIRRTIGLDHNEVGLSAKNTFKAGIEYDGSGFHGWQKQPGLRTVQTEVEKAFELILGHGINIHAAGRTDAGVHALDQIISFKTAADVIPKRLMYGVNAVLPEDIAIKSLEPAPPGFHARWSAVSRTYEYRIINSPYRPVFERGRALFYRVPLEVGKMSEALFHFVGEHDFAAFCAKTRPLPHYTRTIEDVSLTDDEGLIRIRVTANGFLHNMVRIMVGTLIEVGVGKIEPSHMIEMIASGERDQAGFTAPAFGLYLVKIKYS